jgi:hypothetical protein
MSLLTQKALFTKHLHRLEEAEAKKLNMSLHAFEDTAVEDDFFGGK